MMYRSNLTCPDLTPRFKHLHVRPMGHSFGHDVPSDWADKKPKDMRFGIYKNCGMWTHDEAAILYNVSARTNGDWVDIGAHTGWTTAHIGLANPVIAVEPMLCDLDFALRFVENVGEMRLGEFHGRSDEYFASAAGKKERVGFCIDGDHEPGKPLEDARGAVQHLAQDGVIIFHDFIGKPVREAVQWLMSKGFSCCVYFTPHMIACCWRGAFMPPLHIPDPGLPDLKARCPDFDFGRCV